jgi:predicted nuclease of predicted toxin-antitoxin system
VKILIDMNLSPRWVTLFRSAGIEANHWSAVGARDAPDTAIMAYAADNDWVVLTSDLDFSSILAATRGGKPSVVQIRAKDVIPSALNIDPGLTPTSPGLSAPRGGEGRYGGATNLLSAPGGGEAG